MLEYAFVNNAAHFKSTWHVVQQNERNRV